MKRALLLVFLSSVAVVAIAACESRGAKVYASHRCHDCHTLKGKGGSAGPNLTNVGRRRSREFIAQQIRDPKVNNANTNMPSFKDMSDEDINILADYLASLR
jgi:mono/diheme cytochrome c family protein